MSKKSFRKNHKTKVRRSVILAATVVVVVFGAAALLLGNGASDTAAAGIGEGALAPNFRLPAATGEMISLSQFRGKQNVLLFFHEGLSCDPCLEQVAELEKTRSGLDAANVVLLSIAYDSAADQKLAGERLGIRTPMLSYREAGTEVDYDLTRFSMGMNRRAGHTFILVGTDGQIKWRKDYWPGVGHMVPGGTMFVEASEVVRQVQTALGRNG